MKYGDAIVSSHLSEDLMDEIKVWPGRKLGQEASWRKAIRDFDKAFHRWLSGTGSDDDVWNAYDDFNAILSDDYLENELTAKPEFPRYGTKHLREEEQYCSRRGEIVQDAIELIDGGEALGADDLATFRRAMYLKSLKTGLWSDFVDVDYSVTAPVICHFRFG